MQVAQATDLIDVVVVLLFLLSCMSLAASAFSDQEENIRVFGSGRRYIPAGTVQRTNWAYVSLASLLGTQQGVLQRDLLPCVAEVHRVCHKVEEALPERPKSRAVVWSYRDMQPLLAALD